mmetsp:Transcript_1528/g.2153  ORF Transcript_1528/g.2153 Transcript_1528/m.2153 type:complete len:197 (-) Transcript_1528:194-784(-)|eukprot:CAMPEP_0198136876 /NCGR_PEP_ID=MMETSP1443-20131203/440_1 /TAXON_ID=186043 /ORGANISM="Entomoneis sp., Strain CCMP2396" /LENGTH=196 /DNA_ID=CAMNT_0043798163 /DNA_START=17 /DNA_END=607 /DNA_ORIENTATION=-
MKTAIIASLIASAAAFAPASRSGPSTSLAGAVDSMAGKIDFRGEAALFDPLGLSATYEPFLPFFREAELRHGRTAMLAVLGMIVPDFVRVPGDMYSFAAVPNTVDAHDALISQGPMLQLLVWISLWDTIVTAPAVAATMKGEREAGDFAWNLVKPSDPVKYAKKVDAELRNGRLAMMATGGIFTQSIITGHGFPFL